MAPERLASAGTAASPPLPLGPRARTVVMDVDGTLAGPPPLGDYSQCPVIVDTAIVLSRLHVQGWKIVLHTARGMRTHAGDVTAIKEHVLPTLVAWLDANAVPYDEVVIGKPWPGRDGFYVDDRAIRPSEFSSLTVDEIDDLLSDEQDRSGGPPRSTI